MESKPLVGMAVLALMISACSDSSNDRTDSPGMTGSAISSFTVQQPDQFIGVRALDLDALYANVTINGQDKRYDQGTRIITTFPVTFGEMLDVQVQWFETYQNEALLLASWTLSQQVTEDISITVDSADYTSTGNAFDDDSDRYSNLQERRSESDPRNPDDTPINRPDARIRWVNPAEAPVIDGLYDSIWDRANFSDVDGEQLFIDNLMINQGALRPDGDTEFRWFALHDDTNLYVFVLGENVETGTPIRDSTSVWQDDNLNLFFDGNRSRGPSYDGVDDRHILVPLLTSRENPDSNSTVFVVGENSAPVASLEFATCLCSAGQHTWEIKIPFADFNIRKNVPFGFDVQIDEDNDGGARDARWGWFHPSRTTEDVDNTWTTPSFMGTVVVE